MLVFVCLFAIGAAFKTKAGTGDNVTGWIWGGSEDPNDGIINDNETGVGWISMNSINCNPDSDLVTEGGAENAAFPNCPSGKATSNYGVSIPPSGNLSGYGWSENIGAIAFSGPYLNGCPAGNGDCTARRVGNDLQGWARIIDIAEANADGNSGGWEGWIKLNGVAGNGAPYGVAIEPDGKLRGYAWSGGDSSGYELGAISFRGMTTNNTEYGAEIPGPPEVSLSADKSIINLDSASLPQNITLTWTVENGAGATCVKSGGDWSSKGNFIPASNVSETKSEGVSQSIPSVTYRLTCTGPGGVGFGEANVTTGCGVETCASQQCNSNLMPTGSSDTSACDALSTCTAPEDCKPKDPGTWIEVEP